MGPNRDLDKSPCYQSYTLFVTIHFNVIIPSTCCLISGNIRPGFPTKVLHSCLICIICAAEVYSSVSSSLIVIKVIGYCYYHRHETATGIVVTEVLERRYQDTYPRYTYFTENLTHAIPYHVSGYALVFAVVATHRTTITRSCNVVCVCVLGGGKGRCWWG